MSKEIRNTIFNLPEGSSSGSSWTPQYQLVLDAMPTQPSGADRNRQSKWLKRMIDGGYYAKAELLDMFSCDTAANSLINMKSPGTFDPELVGTPGFRKYGGFKPLANSVIRLHFTPSSDGTLISQNNICAIIGVADNIPCDQDDFGAKNSNINDLAYLGIRAVHSNGNAYFRINGNTAISIANTNAIKYYTVVRNGANSCSVFLNKTKTVVNSVSDGLTNIELYAGGMNAGGTIISNERRVRFVFVFSFLSDVEISDVIDITEEYLGTYHTSIINHDWQDNFIAISDKATAVQIPLTTYDGSGQTCHPSVVNIGHVWNDYQYWMANTPLPGGVSTYEDPSIWASVDGETFVVPAGVTNPVIAHPGGGGFNADPGLFYNNEDDKLYLIWKDSGAGGVKLKMSSSSDGITWSNPVIVLTTIGGEVEDVSPSLVKVGNIFYIYFVATSLTPTYVVKRVSCATIDGTYGDREIVNISAIYDDQYIWHIDVKVINGIYYLVSLQGETIDISKSVDGINFVNKIAPIIVIGDNPWATGLYRPCLEIIEGQPTVYYGTTVGSVFGCAKIDVDLL